MNVTFSDHLARLMAERCWKAADLARESGLSHVAIGNYLKGRVPKYAEASRIAAVFGISPDYLLNPALYASPLKIAAQIAESATGGAKDRQRIFEAAERALSASMLPNDGTSAQNEAGTLQGAGVVDWRTRALSAEKQLAKIKATLKKTVEEIEPPSKT
jgi:transcriptional regulator with XRE-family HTH domain